MNLRWSKNGIGYAIILGILGAASPASARIIRPIKPGEVILSDKCRSSPTSCICEPGNLPRIFVAYNGLKYQECVPSSCGQGAVLIEHRSKGGKPDFVCQAVKDVPYSEPPLAAAKPAGKK